jgi:hypothetical protein
MIWRPKPAGSVEIDPELSIGIRFCRDAQWVPVWLQLEIGRLIAASLPAA